MEGTTRRKAASGAATASAGRQPGNQHVRRLLRRKVKAGDPQPQRGKLKRDQKERGDAKLTSSLRASLAEQAQADGPAGSLAGQAPSSCPPSAKRPLLSSPDLAGRQAATEALPQACDPLPVCGAAQSRSRAPPHLRVNFCPLFGRRRPSLLVLLAWVGRIPTRAAVSRALYHGTAAIRSNLSPTDRLFSPPAHLAPNSREWPPTTKKWRPSATRSQSRTRLRTPTARMPWPSMTKSRSRT